MAELFRSVMAAGSIGVVSLSLTAAVNLSGISAFVAFVFSKTRTRLVTALYATNLICLALALTSAAVSRLGLLEFYILATEFSIWFGFIVVALARGRREPLTTRKE